MNEVTIRVRSKSLFWSEVEKAIKEIDNFYGVKAEYHMDYIHGTHWLLTGYKDALKNLIANGRNRCEFLDWQDAKYQLKESCKE